MATEQKAQHTPEYEVNAGTRDGNPNPIDAPSVMMEK